MIAVARFVFAQMEALLLFTHRQSANEESPGFIGQDAG